MAKLSEKIGYALGDAAAGGITWKVMSIAFPLFFTNVFGLTVADTATLMLIARMFDVVTDPLMGSLADRTQSRWGTYRPWLIFGAVPLGLIFALLLYTPDLGLTGKRIWAYTFYLLMMVVYTAVNVPYGSSASVCGGGSIAWFCSNGRHLGLRFVDERAQEACPCREVLLKTLCRPVP